MGQRERRSLPTSRDVAELAGVSQSTVSYVMSGKRSVSDETKTRVREAMAQLTYQPNAGARALRGSKTNVIALMVHLDECADVVGTVPYIDEIVDQARKRDYDVVLITTDEGPDGLVRMARRSNCDAFILMDVKVRDDRIATAAGLGLPVVLMGTPMHRSGLDAVDFDAREAAAMLVDELADTGHERAVVVGESADVPSEQFRFITEFHDGCRARAGERGLGFALVARERDGWAGIEEAAPRLLEHRDGRLGLIARTPQVTEWLLLLARVNGLAPGGDLSIASLCTDAAAESFSTPVTNVSTEVREQSRVAMEILFELMEDSERRSRLQLVAPLGVRRRATTAVWTREGSATA